MKKKNEMEMNINIKTKNHTGNLQQIRSVEEEDTENLESTVEGSMIKTPLK